jgi:hypothetical protein
LRQVPRQMKCGKFVPRKSLKHNAHPSTRVVSISGTATRVVRYSKMNLKYRRACTVYRIWSVIFGGIQRPNRISCWRNFSRQTPCFIYLQASPTADDFKERMKSFAKRYPNTAQYIQAIDPYKWVYYAQVCYMFYLRFNYKIMNTLYAQPSSLWHR